MMILTCPNCATRFFVERESVGAAGRRVKCSACATEWVAYRADDGEVPEGASVSAPTSPSAATAPVSRDPGAVEHEASGHDLAGATDDVAAVAPAHEAAPQSHDVEADEAEAPVAGATWPEAAEQAGSETAEADAPPAEEAPLFTERTAAAQTPAKRRGGSSLLLLLLLVLVVAAVAGLIYYRSHHAPSPPPARVSGTQEPGAIRG